MQEILDRLKVYLEEQKNKMKASGFENDPRVFAKAEELRDWMDFDAAINTLAVYMVQSDDDAQTIDLLHKTAVQLVTAAKAATAESLDHMDNLHKAAIIGQAMSSENIKSKITASNRGKAAANALHARPGGSREKQEQIRAMWATGKYESRDMCAEQECAALDMGFGTARRALRKTPEPIR
ncbi:hypothetical protein [Acidovorax sp. SRB_24]|uniref:hypothetical protein n=1 Tax=Acidovorax sp. SRB_24 TaxID=1962700 RepID=UPI00145ED3D8|nr:hypothetical protein [Acidovorax sp. SRB_24]